MLLLQIISRFFEAVASLPGGEGAAARAKALSAAATLETPCQAALITAYVHHSELAMTAKSRTLLLQLRQQMRALLQAEKDRIGLNTAGFAHLRRVLKRNSGASLEVPAPVAAKAKAGAPGKKRKR